MKNLGLVFVILGFTLAAVPAIAQAGETSFTIETHTEGGGGYFALQGQTTRNPPLVVPPSETISVTLVGMDDGVHNIQVQGNDPSEYVTTAGESITYTFTSPASGTVQYWCVPHRGAGMAGNVQVAGDGGENGATPTNGENGGGENNTPGVQVAGVALAMLGAALIIGRRRN